MRIVAFFFFFTRAFLAFATDCSGLENPRSSVTAGFILNDASATSLEVTGANLSLVPGTKSNARPPLISPLELQEQASHTKMSQGFYLYSWPHVQNLCSLLETSDSLFCLNTSATILSQAMNCLRENLSIKELKPLSWSFLRNPEIAKLITQALIKKSTSDKEAQILKNIWAQYRVLILPGNTPTPLGMTKNWKIHDLEHLEKSFEKLKQAITHAVGENNIFQYSHIWGAGGALARLGELSINGQFGEIYDQHPMQINVVIDDLQMKKNSKQIAQQIAHENAHSSYYLMGRYLTGNAVSWSETSFSKIFEMCDLPVNYETSLKTCLKENPTWFNFHPTSYPATRSAEFYTKMVDHWVRENLFLTTRSSYQCQDKQTVKLWKEMEFYFIGNSLSASCDFTK